MNKVPSKDGTPIAFDRSGKGPAVILVGGAFQYRAIDPRTACICQDIGGQFPIRIGARDSLECVTAHQIWGPCDNEKGAHTHFVWCRKALYMVE
jgi:hypothetical protein